MRSLATSERSKWNRLGSDHSGGDIGCTLALTTSFSPYGAEWPLKHHYGYCYISILTGCSHAVSPISAGVTLGIIRVMIAGTNAIDSLCKNLDFCPIRIAEIVASLVSA